MDDRRKILAKEWFDAAISDYQYAEVGLREEHIYPQIAFLSQQVAEKLLNLMGFYIESRYPPDMPQYSREEIVEAFSSAQRVKEKIEKAVQKSPHG